MSAADGTDLFTATAPSTPSPSSKPGETAVVRAVIAIVITLLGVVGNGTIIAVILRTRSLRNITGVFLVNLAVADLSVALWTLPFIIDAAFWGRWRFGEVWCQTCGFLEVLFTSASVSTLGLISYDRYVAIVKPLHYQQCMTAPRATAYLLCIWVIALTCACLPMSSIASYGYIEDIGACTVDWKEAAQGYTIIVHTLGFCLPLLMILFCYAKIFIVARRVKRQIRPAPANFTEPTSRAVNDQSGCDSVIVVNGPRHESHPYVRNVPDRNSGGDLPLRSLPRDNAAGPRSECNTVFSESHELDSKRSQSAQDILNNAPTAMHRDMYRELIPNCRGKFSVKDNFSVPMGVAMVPGMFQNHQARPSDPLETNSRPRTRHPTLKRFSLNEESLRSKRRKGRLKSSVSVESGEWKSGTARFAPRKAAKMKKMQSLRDTKAATTLLILLGVFLLCWIPYVVICFLLNAQVDIRASVHSGMFMVALTNSVLNVFVYGILNTKFRMGFRKLWRPCWMWLSCRCKQQDDSTPGLRIRSISQSLRNNGIITERSCGPARREYFSEQVA